MNFSFFIQTTGVKSAIYIPLGTRFGPLVGEVCVKEHAPNGKRKYFWRVSFTKHCAVIIHYAAFHNAFVH